jgi:uncharacterized membrane protein
MKATIIVSIVIVLLLLLLLFIIRAVRRVNSVKKRFETDSMANKKLEENKK